MTLEIHTRTVLHKFNIYILLKDTYFIAVSFFFEDNMAHSSGSTGGTENNNSLQQLISPQELNDRFNEVISMVRGERNRTELDVNEYVVSKESTYWDDFCKTAHLPPSKVDANEYKDFLLNCGDTLRKIGEPLAASELYYLEYII